MVVERTIKELEDLIRDCSGEPPFAVPKVILAWYNKWFGRPSRFYGSCKGTTCIVRCGNLKIVWSKNGRQYKLLSVEEVIE